MTVPPSPSVIYFGLDRADPAVRRRVDQLRRAGVLIAACTFHRDKQDGENSGQSHPDRDLGYTWNGSFLARLPALCLAFLKLLGWARWLRPANTLLARNMDLLLLAVLLKKTGVFRGAIVYEVLDIHFRLLGDTPMARLLRRIEGALLRSVRLVVVSAEDFKTQYFDRYFPACPPLLLLENRLYLDGLFESRPDVKAKWCAPDRSKSAFDDRNIQLGWVGALRCEASAEILRNVARAHPQTVTLHIAGRPTFCSEEALRQYFSGLANVRFRGRYVYPDDLLEIYGALDLNWCVDLKYMDDASGGTNATWLLPNRLYEGGYFAVPQIGRAGTAAGRYIAHHRIGWLLSGDPAAALNALLASLDPAAYEPVKRQCRALMDRQFHYADDIANVLASLPPDQSGL